WFSSNGELRLAEKVTALVNGALAGGAGQLVMASETFDRTIVYRHYVYDAVASTLNAPLGSLQVSDAGQVPDVSLGPDAAVSWHNGGTNHVKRFLIAGPMIGTTADVDFAGPTTPAIAH